MIRLLLPALLLSLGIRAEEEQKQEDVVSTTQVPLVKIEATPQPQQQFLFPQQQQQFAYQLPQQFAPQQQQHQQFVQQPTQPQQYFQFQQQQPQFVQQQQPQRFVYFQQQPQQHQQFYYPVQYQFPVPRPQPAYQMTPKITVPTGLLRKHLNASDDEPSVFAMSYNPETGVKIATINGKKVFAYKQRFPGAPKESVEIVDNNAEVSPSGNPVVVASTNENSNGEKEKNVWFDDKEDPMVKIEKEPVNGETTTTAAPVDPNLPVVSQDGEEASTTAAPVTSTVASEVPISAGAVTVTPVPFDSSSTMAPAEFSSTMAVPVAGAALAADATIVPTTTLAPGVPTTTPVPNNGESFFAMQNPMYMQNFAAFASKFPQYFPTRFVNQTQQQQIPIPMPPLDNPQMAAFPSSTVAPVPAGYQVPVQLASGLSQVQPVYQQQAVSTTSMPIPVQAQAQFMPRPVFMAQQAPAAAPPVQYVQSTPLPVLQQQQPQQYVQPVAVQVPQPRPVFVAQPQYLPPQQQFVHSTPVPVIQQQQYVQTAPQPVPQQYIQTTAVPVVAQQQPQYIQPPPQPTPQQYVQAVPVQATSQQYYVPPAPQPQYYTQTSDSPVFGQYTTPAPAGPPRQSSNDRNQQTTTTRSIASAPNDYPPISPRYPAVSRPAPPMDFTEEEIRNPKYETTTRDSVVEGTTTGSRYVSSGDHDPTTFAPRYEPTRRPYYPQRPTATYPRPSSRQPYRRPQPQRRYNPNGRYTYYKAGTRERVDHPFGEKSRYAPTHKAARRIQDYVPSPSYRNNKNNGNRNSAAYSRPASSPVRQPPSRFDYRTTTTTTTTARPIEEQEQSRFEAPAQQQTAEEQRIPVRVINEEPKTTTTESPFESMEFLSTAIPFGSKKDVKITFINRARKAAA